MKTPLRLRKWLARQLMPELDNMRTDANRQANTEPVDSRIIDRHEVEFTGILQRID